MALAEASNDEGREWGRVRNKRVRERDEVKWKKNLKKNSEVGHQK